MTEPTTTERGVTAKMGTVVLGQSSDWWNGALIVAVVIAAIGAVAVVVATVGVVISQKREAAASAERVASLELQAEQLRKRAASRSIKEEFAEALRDAPKPKSVIISYIRDAPDGFSLSMGIYRELNGVGWPVSLPRPIDPPKPDRSRFSLDDMPTAMSVRGQSSGVTLVGSSDSFAPQDPEFKDERFPITFLIKAFLTALTDGVKVTGDERLPSQTIRIVVAPK